MAEHRHKDELSGIETTGHEWDGIRELDNPLPRWWQWIFWATVVWSVGYWVVYPSWPLVTSYATGVIGYSSRAELATEIDAARAAQQIWRDRLATASLEDVRTEPELLEFALAGGRSAFAVNCSQCHGSGAQGFKGYPNLNDDDWLWGGSLEAIAHSITHGIRNTTDADARMSEMPAFGRDAILKPAEIGDVTEYVLSLGGRADDPAAAERGRPLYADNCAACHGPAGQGNHELGAPALADDIWLYGGDRAAIALSIANSRNGVMPAWGRILDPVTIKQLTVYVHSLGGGQ